MMIISWWMLVFIYLIILIQLYRLCNWITGSLWMMNL
jgi:hypothetical protein